MANPAPVGYYVSPRIQPAAGGSGLQLVGRDLDPASISVTVGGGAVAAIEGVSRFLCQFRCPAHAAGAANVVVTTTDGSFTLTGAVTYV
jgi:hypothetical protein